MGCTTFACSWAAWLAQAFAQMTVTGTISGTVVDPSGQFVPARPSRGNSAAPDRNN